MSGFVHWLLGSGIGPAVVSLPTGFVAKHLARSVIDQAKSEAQVGNLTKALRADLAGVIQFTEPQLLQLVERLADESRWLKSSSNDESVVEFPRSVRHGLLSVDHAALEAW